VSTARGATPGRQDWNRVPQPTCEASCVTMMSPNTFGGTTLVHVPGVAVGGDAVAGLGDQPGERTQQHTTGRTGHGAVRIGDRHRAVRTRHVHRERRH